VRKNGQVYKCEKGSDCESKCYQCLKWIMNMRREM